MSPESQRPAVRGPRAHAASPARGAGPAGELLAVQRLFAQGIMRPLTGDMRCPDAWPDGRPASTVIAGFIKPNARLTARERLEIYQRQYWFRLFDSLREDFPGLRAVLGARRFVRLLQAYLEAYPPHRFSLRDAGADLPRFLAERPELLGPVAGLARDVARLEWARIDAFDGPQSPPLRPEDAAALDVARTRLALQPCLRLLELEYPADAVLPGEEKSLGRRALQKLLRPGRCYLVVHRQDYRVFFQRVSAPQFAALRALSRTATLQQACRQALKLADGAAAAAALMQELGGWFTQWAALGWVVQPGRR